MLQGLKEKRAGALVLGILPRLKVSDRLLSKAIYFNSCLNKACSDFVIKFINTWRDFDNRELFLTDGTHLNSWGSPRLGRILNENVCKYWKNLECNLNYQVNANRAPS